MNRKNKEVKSTTEKYVNPLAVFGGVYDKLDIEN